ncbi:unnamed protein product [Symbiodinium microadriaticum]|nr:unnamed protein product [Symbiodinium microadriaticum]
MASLPTLDEAAIPASTPAFQRLRDYILEGREAQIGELRISSSERPEVWLGMLQSSLEDLVEEGGSETQGGAGDHVWEQRLRSLELGMRQLQTSMQALVDGVPLSREEPAEPSHAPATAGGVPEDQLIKMSQVASAGRGRLKGRAKATPRRAADPLDESDDEAALATGDGGVAVSGNQVTQAMIQISQVLKAMHSEREKRNDLEELLDRADGGGDALGGSGSSGRSKTAAFHKLRGILRNSPELISASIEGLISEDFYLAQSGPGLEDRKCTVRATIVDQLNSDQPEAAKATALLALASLDQAAIDQGNWLLASEFTMQPSPPFSAFQRPRTLDPLEARQTKIIDPRWVSVFMSRLKERDGTPLGGMGTYLRSLHGSLPRGSLSFVFQPLLKLATLSRLRFGGMADSVTFSEAAKVWLLQGVEDWNNSGPFGPEELGRSAPKFESLYDMLHACQVEYRELPAEADLEEAVFSFSAPCHVLPVEPDRLNFVDRPSFDPRPYLDTANRRTYEDPIRFAEPVTEEVLLPHVAVRASKDQARNQIIVPALGTMAMGDTNAVAYGSGCVVAGLLIDDFVLLDPVIDGYRASGLPRHEGKAVSRASVKDFWGGQLDGKTGILRPSPKRVSEMAAFLLAVVQGGVTSVGMLEVITGSLVSGLQLRRAEGGFFRCWMKCMLFSSIVRATRLSACGVTFAMSSWPRLLSSARLMLISALPELRWS